MILFRLLDEILFFGYRKTAFKDPVFIISNPRSGTTYLHNLFCLDEKRFTYFRLYHTFFPSILFYKFIKLLIKIDSHIGWIMKKFFNRIEEYFFGSWDGVHTLRFEQSEEDEGIFTLQMMSPAIGLFCPWFNKMDWIVILDNLDEKKKKKMMSFYKNTLQRFVYAWGEGKTLLVKNVLSTGRINMMLESFPNAKIIYPVRSPYNTIPSIISMFTAPWRIIAPSIPKDSPEFRAWGDISISYYLHFTKIIDSLNPANFYTFNYNDLINDPYALMMAIYNHFDLEVEKEFDSALLEACNMNKKYKSIHKYTLEEYGFSKEIINRRLHPFFERYPEFLKED